MFIENKMIKLTLNHTKLLDDNTKVSKPSTRKLYQSIQRAMKFTYQTRLFISNKARQLLYIDFFFFKHEEMHY